METATRGTASERSLLRGVSIFADLDGGALSALERVAEPREFPEGAVIVSQEEPGESLYVLVRGRVKVVLYGPTGREVILYIFRSPGDFFGEMSLLDDQPRSATVIAAERSRLLSLSRADFQQHIAAHPRTALRVLTELSRRLRRADEVIGNLALLDVYGRLATKLKEMAESEGEEREDGILIRERPTQAEIAAMIGTSRETVSRALSELARRGFLEMSGKRLLLRRAFLVDETLQRAVG
ncbi:MAG TPA: Crp/Fnr family transcriptional regulator [Anaeromyxobacter sp.]|nr:Crp/Fnr family transcriptional regulator [Anaeromyxobacter sp.]